jgi:uncharacterized DUF497 family protein
MKRSNGMMQKPPSLAQPRRQLEMARDVFNDIFAIEWTDNRHGDAEERFARAGMVEGRLLFVAYTLRGERIRTMSAREAEPRERRRYHNENQT